MLENYPESKAGDDSIFFFNNGTWLKIDKLLLQVLNVIREAETTNRRFTWTTIKLVALVP